MPVNLDSPTLPPVPAQAIASPRNDAALALARDARADLARLNFPARVGAARDRPGWNAGAGRWWPAPACARQTVHALLREGVANLRVIDRAARGEEGPWGTFARMLTLRSPKHLTGPDLGVPSLTFRAWYEAQHGDAGWAALHKIGRIDWRDYLLGARHRGLPVDNGVSLVSVDDAGGLLRARLQSARGTETVWARKLVLALGREGSGAPRWPAFPSLRRDDPLAAGRVFHSADAIDFAALAGQRVGVLGAGASAFDNAACALEAGARVDLFARRPFLPQVNKSKWTAFAGFFRGYEALDDARKWRLYTYIFDEQVPPPWETVRRCDAHEGFALRLGSPWLDVRPQPGGVQVATPAGTEGSTR